MAKPIFIVEAPNVYGEKYLDDITKLLENKLEDYHILVVGNKEKDEFNFKVFYEKDFTEIELNDLRELIKNKLK